MFKHRFCHILIVFVFLRVKLSVSVFITDRVDYSYNGSDLDEVKHTKTTFQLFGEGSFFLAKQICQGHKRKLVKINSPDKNDAVTWFIKNQNLTDGPFWTSANKLMDEITWSFSFSEPVNYFNWAPGEPNNVGGSEDCVEIYKNGSWNDQRCGVGRLILCE